MYALLQLLDGTVGDDVTPFGLSVCDGDDMVNIRLPFARKPFIANSSIFKTTILQTEITNCHALQEHMNERDFTLVAGGRNERNDTQPSVNLFMSHDHEVFAVGSDVADNLFYFPFQCQCQPEAHCVLQRRLRGRREGVGLRLGEVQEEQCRHGKGKHPHGPRLQLQDLAAQQVPLTSDIATLCLRQNLDTVESGYSDTL